MRFKKFLEEESIVKSLEIAASKDAAHKKKRGAILDRQPDGTIAIAHRREYVKQTIGGDIFWLSKKDTLTSSQLATEMGTTLEKQFKEK